ncbi:MAG TPA: sugar ABC transporter permease [Pseudonocardiaceae bacterium]|jgi:raffinose/stachyose/melibiose transport system permease protein|nr:sugar ABC transporter permease [Pseudonocardiaceae bacterium]
MDTNVGVSADVGVVSPAGDRTLPPGAATRAGRMPVRPARRSRRGRTRWELVVLLGPALVVFVGFVLVPIGIAAYYSLYNWTGFGPLSDFVGIQNYHDAVTGNVFQRAVLHNLIIAVLSVVIQLPLSIGLALLLNRRLHGRTFLRVVVFAPYVLSEAITAVIWLLMLQPGGFVDQLFRVVGLGGLIHLWLASTHIVLYTLFVVITWKYIGFGIILLLAGLQGVPSELREAAALDGASAWQATRYVTLPLLGPTIRIWIFLSVIGSLQLFDLVWIMTLGGPANASTTMASYLIDHGFKRSEFGYGSAVAVILFAICFVFALLYQRFALRRDTAGALTRPVG